MLPLLPLNRVVARLPAFLLICLLFLLPFHARAQNRVWTWGYNGYGQLGSGTRVSRSTPDQIGGLSDIVSIACGAASSLALKSDGTLWAWGYNVEGEVGDGTTIERDSPVQVSGISDVVAVAMGDYHCVALKSDGTVWTWGYNWFGQLGDGTQTSRHTPVQVPGLSGIKAIASGGDHVLALGSDGTVWTWGYNWFGQLGDGSTTDRPLPVPVSGLTDVKAVAAGSFHSFAIKSDGTVVAWGRNSDGQLGDGTRINRLNPVQVAGLLACAQVAGGEAHGVAVRLNGTVYTWGRNDHGQLGDGTTTSHDAPAAVPGLSGVRSLSVGVRHNLVIRTDGTVWGWGNNDQGQLGDGSKTDRAIPVQALRLGHVAFISAGAFHGAALTPETPSALQVDSRSGNIGRPALLRAVLKRADNNNPLPNKIVRFLIDGAPIAEAATDANGAAAVYWAIPSIFDLGSHPLTAVFDGDTDYVPSTSNATLTVAKGISAIRSTTRVDVQNFMIGEKAGFAAHLTNDSDGRFLENRTVSFFLNGILLGQAVTDQFGDTQLIARIPASVGSGSKTLRVSFAGDNRYYSSSQASSLTVSKAYSTLEWTTKSWYQYGQIGQTVLLSGRLTTRSLEPDAQPVPLPGRTLVFTLGGQVVGQPRTGADGVASVWVSLSESMGAGVKWLTVDFAGDDTYYAAGQYAMNYPVYKGTTAIGIESVTGALGQNVVLTAHLTRAGDGGGVSGRTVHFSVQGALAGSAVTDASGTAHVNYTVPLSLGTGTKNVTVTFNGDALYYSVTRTVAALTVNP